MVYFFLMAVKDVWGDGLQGWPCKPCIQALSTESTGYNFFPFMPLWSFICLLGFFLVVLVLLKRRSEVWHSLGVRFVKIYGMESRVIQWFVKKSHFFLFCKLCLYPVVLKPSIHPPYCSYAGRRFHLSKSLLTICFMVYCLIDTYEKEKIKVIAWQMLCLSFVLFQIFVSGWLALGNHRSLKSSWNIGNQRQVMIFEIDSEMILFQSWYTIIQLAIIDWCAVSWLSSNYTVVVEWYWGAILF